VADRDRPPPPLAAVQALSAGVLRTHAARRAGVIPCERQALRPRAIRVVSRLDGPRSRVSQAFPRYGKDGQGVSEEITIRRAALADYPGFLSVARATHEHPVALLPEIFRSVETPLPEEYFAGVVTGDDSDALVAERAGEIVGYAVLYLRRATLDILVPRTAGFIGNFGVSAACRRMGIGRLLLEACCDWAREKGAISLDLDCWEANQGAMRFYEEMGMRVTRRWLTLDL
jgi:diamine N-acetyltransferase